MRALSVLLLLANLVRATDEAQLADLQTSIKERKGLCLCIGTGSKTFPGLAADLAAGSRMLVHGLAIDSEACARALEAIRSKNVAGQASVEKLSLAPLPLLNDLATVVVVEDLAAAKAAGVTLEEIMRVTSPFGSVWIHESGRWSKTFKPLPKEMDEWTHPHHGADGNMVSTEKTLVPPLGLRWLDGLPKSLGGCTGTQSWIMAGGRLYSLGTNEVENLAGESHPIFGGDGLRNILCARDAFNGLPLWKMDCGPRGTFAGIRWVNEAPLAADSASVFVASSDKVLIVDGATGKVKRTGQAAGPVERLLLIDGMVIAAWWQEEQIAGPGKGLPVFVNLPKGGKGGITAFDAESGERKWSLDAVAFRMIAADGTVYFSSALAPDNPVSSVTAVTAATGALKWKLTNETMPPKTDLDLGVAGRGFVTVIASEGAKSADALLLSSADGKIVQRKAFRHRWTPIVEGKLWFAGEALDPLTGKPGGKAGAVATLMHCQPPVLMPPYLLDPKGGGISLKKIAYGKEDTEEFTYFGARGGCIQGMVPAYGMLYTPPNNCRCIPGQPFGFNAIGHSGEWPGEREFTAARPIETGPAFGKVESIAANAGDWPTLRQNFERSGATNVAGPKTLKPVWKASLINAAASPLYDTWKSQVGSSLTAPVIAGDTVFVAAGDTGQLYALDASTGKIIWSAVLPSRVDSPPTVHKGLCLIGCHDGCVYALRASDGQPAWKTRIAPRETRMVAFGRVESVWPATGAVLMGGDTAFANAGRTSDFDGGVALAAFDPATGKTKWARGISPGAFRTNDVLTRKDDAVAWHYLRFAFNDGRQVAPQEMPKLKEYGGGHVAAQGGMLDGSWTRFRSRMSGNGYRFGSLMANLACWNDEIIIAQTGKDCGAFARKDQSPLWKTPSGSIEAIALTTDCAIIAGTAQRDPKSAFISILNLKGEKLAGEALESAPTYDGIAVTPKLLVVSLQNGSVVAYRGAAE